MNPKFRISTKKVKKRRWPFDAAVTIALLAVALSAIQFVVTAPLFTAMFVAPKIIVSGAGAGPNDPTLIGVWTVSNEGLGIANRIEIGFSVLEGSRISFMPNIPVKVTREEHAASFQNLNIEIDRLFSKESILIFIAPPLEPKKIPAEILRSLSSIKGFQIPSVAYARSSEEGPAKLELKRLKESKGASSSPSLPSSAPSSNHTPK